MAQRNEAEYPYDPEGMPNPNPGDTGGRWDDPIAGAGGGGCGAGTVPETIGADGNWRTANPGECIDMAEFNRRVDLNIKNNPGPGGGGGGQPQGGGGAAPKPASPFPAGQGPQYDFAPVPEFDAPEFAFGETFQAPTEADMLKEPGYQFRLGQGQKALEQSAAGRGTLRTGGTLKDILGYGQNFASQEYGNVYNRGLQGYNTRFGTAKDIFDRNYMGKKDEFAPKMIGWQTLTAAEQRKKDLAWQAYIDKWFHDNLSAADLWNGSQG